MVLLMLFLLCGCAFEDIDRRAFVTSIGLDPPKAAGSKYNLTIKISLAKGDPESIGSDFVLLHVNCNSISEGLDKLRSMSDKKLEYGHVKALMFGEAIVKDDISQPVEYFMKRADIQKIAYMGIGKPSAYELLKFKPKEEAVASSYLFYSFERSRTQSPYVYAVPLYDASRRILTPGLDLTLPVMEYERGNLHVDRIALFHKKQYKLELTSDESKLLKLMTTGFRDDTFALKTKNGSYSITTEKGTSSYQLAIGNGGATAIVDIKLRGTLIERLGNAEAVTEEVKLPIMKETKAQIESQVRKLLIKMRDEGVDPLGFGLRYRARKFHHAKETEEWNGIYPRLKFDVRVSVKNMDS
ncbi:germination protein, Ger(x)C family [Paenibacillus sp. OV219]|nr:germination protein, Ger(x)C family [Paenibacillus sp. OV219]